MWPTGIPAVEFLAPLRLWAIPGAVLFFVIVGSFAIRRRGELKKSIFAREFMEKGDMLPCSMKIVAIVAIAFAAVCFALAWAKPEAISQVTTPRFGGIRLVYISDVSISMDATDVEEGGVIVSRIAAAKQFLLAFEHALASDPEITGNYPRTMIPFAGAAATYGGFTASSIYMHELITFLSTEGMIGRQGSDLSLAIETYRTLIEDNPKDNATVDIGIILSDGGNDPGGFAIDIGALNESLSGIREKAEIIAVGFGGDDATTIPNRRLVTKEVFGPYGETMEIPDAQIVGGMGGVLLKPSGEPWTSAFDEEMMANLAGASEKCFRLPSLSDPTDKNGASTTARSSRCRRTQGVSGAVQEVKQLLLHKRTSLPSVTEERRVPVEAWFGAVGFVFLFIGLSSERLYGVWRRRMRERPMREELFR